MSDDNDQLDREVHKRANASKTDPSRAEGVVVPKGDDIPGRVPLDPFASRMAMFKKADAVRDAEAAQGGSLSEAQQALADQMAAEAGDVPHERTEATERTLHLRKKPGTSQSADERVSLTYNGTAISVAKADIDRAGSAENYLRNRQMDEQQLALARQQEELAKREKDLEDRLAATQRVREDNRQGENLAGHGTGPAIRTDDPSGQRRNDAGTQGVDDEALAEELGLQIYAGSPEEASKAVLRILQLTRSRGETVNEEAIVKRVRAELAGQSEGDGKGNPTASTAPVAISPAMALMNKRINDMAANEFGELMKNDEARAAAFARFKKLVALPENRDRLAVDIARDACEQIEPLYANPRERVIERKRELPIQTPASGATHASADDEAVPSNSEFIAMQAARRNFGRRTQ